MNTEILINNTFRIESQLGSGGSGTVYKAWHSRIQKYVVIKELKYGSSESVETQRNEIEALKNIKSPYLPQAYDFIADDERIYTVMEYIEGENLSELLSRGQSFSGKQVAKWYGQLASALIVLHEMDIYHRDIKPSNIMLTPKDDVCLIDFNTALVRGNTVRFISRSNGYTSPEQHELYEMLESLKNGQSGRSIPENEEDALSDTEFAGSTPEAVAVQNEQLREITKKDTSSLMINDIDWKLADIYSLGATMYHVSTGKHPRARVDNEPIYMPGAGRDKKGVARIIERSMQREPSKRPESAKKLAESIQRLEKRNDSAGLNLTKGEKIFFLLLSATTAAAAASAATAARST